MTDPLMRIAACVIQAYELHDASYDPERHCYRVSRYTAAMQVMDAEGITDAAERRLIDFLVAVGGEGAEVAQDIMEAKEAKAA